MGNRIKSEIYIDNRITEDLDRVFYKNGQQTGFYFILKTKNSRGRDVLEIYDLNFNKMEGHQKILREYKAKFG